MSQTVTKIENKSTLWESRLRFRVGETCTYNNVDWVNITGGNSEPGVGVDWKKNSEVLDIIDTLISTDPTKPLSANQGKILKDFIDAINSLLASDDVTLDELQEVVTFIKANRDDLANLSIANIAGLLDALAAKQDDLGYVPANKSESTRTVNTLAEAKSLTDLVDGEAIRVLGREAKNDGLIYDKEFYFFADDVTAENGGTVFTALGGTLKAFVSGSYYLHYFGFSANATSADNATAFNLLQQSVSNGQVVTAKSGTYNLDNVSIIKSGFYDFNGVTFINNNDVSGSSAILIDPAAVTVKIEGLTQQYTGLFYTSNTNHTGSFGIQKTGIIASNSETLLQNCKATGFSYVGFMSVSGNDQLIAIDCVGNNNGYAGILCNYGLYLNVRGGTYNKNGGSNNTDGYGIVANAGLGSAKITGATSLRNRTRNIDSHDITDVIISGNTTGEAGIALPQWFNVAFATGYNIRLTQKVQSAIITNNTAKNSFGGIVVDSFIEAGQLDNKLENILIDDNILENNTENIYIRQLRTNKLSISDNIHVGTGRSLLIDANEVLDDSNFYYIENLKISDNLFSGDIYVDLSNFAGSTKKHEISVSGGSFNQATFFLRDNPTQIKIKDTNHYKVEVSANSTETHLVYEANEVDKNNQASDFTPTSSSFFGTYKIHNNDFLNSNQSFLLRARSNGINTNNRFKNYGANVLFGIQSAATATNFRIKGNEFDNSAAITPIRFNTNADVLVADNVFKGSVRIDYPNGAGTSAKVIQGKVLFDSFNNNYDLGFTSLPSLGDYVFNVGSVMKNNAPTSENPFNWVYTSSGWISQKTNFLTNNLLIGQEVSQVTIPATQADHVPQFGQTQAKDVMGSILYYGLANSDAYYLKDVADDFSDFDGRTTALSDGDIVVFQTLGGLDRFAIHKTQAFNILNHNLSFRTRSGLHITTVGLTFNNVVQVGTFGDYNLYGCALGQGAIIHSASSLADGYGLTFITRNTSINFNRLSISNVDLTNGNFKIDNTHKDYVLDFGNCGTVNLQFDTYELDDDFQFMVVAPNNGTDVVTFEGVGASFNYLSLANGLKEILKTKGTCFLRKNIANTIVGYGDFVKEFEIISSPNGTLYKVGVDDTGARTSTLL